jgi:cardiolipin synthase
MRYKFYTTSKKTWDAMLESIHRATTSVYLEMYIFLNDTFPTHNFYAALEQKARQGVRVHLIMDAFGSYTIPSKDVSRLRAAGVEILFFSEWWYRTHRKILVVDEKVGFIGGVNIGNAYSNWLDLHMRFEGSIVKSITRSFARTYRKCGGTNPHILGLDHDSPLQKAKLWVFDHIPTSEKNPLSSYYRDHIREAQQKITIVTPYFVPDAWLVKELEKALARGVKVEIVIPDAPDVASSNLAVRFFAQKLVPKGAIFFRTRTMLHAKALLIDDREGIVGSHNIDALSFNRNLEAGVLFTRKDMIRDLGRILDSWKRDATIYDPTHEKPRWYDGIISFLIWLLQPIV